MDTTREELTDEEIARRGNHWAKQVIEPTLTAADHGKFLVVDVWTGEYEVDEDDYKAGMRMQERMPDGELFLARVGYRAAASFGGAQ